MAVSRRVFLGRLLAGGAVGALAGAGPASAGNVVYTYDDAGRLTTATYPNGTVLTYRYDAAGNRRQVFQGAAPTDFAMQIRVSASGLSLRDLADVAGYTGTDATITFVVNRNAMIIGASGDPAGPGVNGGNGKAGIDTGTWPPGKTINLELIVMPGAVVMGGGGSGGGGAGGDGLPNGGSGAGGGNGSPGARSFGGVGIECRVPINIVLWPDSYVAGGAGGGAGGAGVAAYFAPPYYPDRVYWNGGGGGGGYPNGVGGAGGVGIPDWPTTDYTWNAPGSPGSDGMMNFPGDGLGGAGGVGGTGGGPTTGGPTEGEPGAAGGSVTAMFGIAKNGHAVTINGPGTIVGGVYP